MNDGKQLSKKTTRILPAIDPTPVPQSGRLVKGSPEAFARMEQLRDIRDAKKKAKDEAEAKAKANW